MQTQLQEGGAFIASHQRNVWGLFNDGKASGAMEVDKELQTDTIFFFFFPQGMWGHWAEMNRQTFFILSAASKVKEKLWWLSWPWTAEGFHICA